MKNFFTNHPFLATFLTSCFVFLLFIGSGIGLFVLILGKAVTSINTELATVYEKDEEQNYQYLFGNKESTNKILNIPVKGIILSDADMLDPFSMLLPNYTYGYEVKKELMNAAKDTSILGVVIEMDTPGGTIGGANAISDGIKYVKDTGKPVIVHVTSLAASGGYWAAASSDEIIADKGSLTGSIGVIMGPFKQYNDVVAEADFSKSVTTLGGIESINITAGEDKDFGDPYVGLSKKAKEKMQEAVDHEYDVFVTHVSSTRNIDADKIKNEIGAYVYSNDKALEYGLIDKEGSKEDAYNTVAEKIGVGDNYQIVGTKRLSFIDALLGVISPFVANRAQTKCLLCNQMLYIHGNPANYGVY